MILSQKKVCTVIAFLFSWVFVKGQDNRMVSGKVIDAEGHPLGGASIKIAGVKRGTLTAADGSFSIYVNRWNDTLEVSNTGFETLFVSLTKDNHDHLTIQLKIHESVLSDVKVTGVFMDKEPGRRYMKKVIANKKLNDPNRFETYSYGQYYRHEVDVTNLDSAQRSSKGLKNLAINIYRNSDSSNAGSTDLHVYFSETISNKYHRKTPAVEQENILARKRLGLQTDDLLRKLDKFNFHFNVYDDWLPVFNQTYASPLNSSAFTYYNFYFTDSTVVDGVKQYRIHFTPKQKFERAFTGSLWINDSSYSISKIDMHLTATANLNFVSDIHYTEEFKKSKDSATNAMEYMPSKYSSVVAFETGLALLGIPVKPNEKDVRLKIQNTTVLDHIKFNVSVPDDSSMAEMNDEATADIDKSQAYWLSHRTDTLSRHEMSIYKMVDSLEHNKKYKGNTKIINALGIGYWDVANKFRVGPLTSLVSTNINEGVRTRVGVWTLPGISKKMNINGYIAYGTKDKLFKSHLGVKYIWNPVKWSRTSISATSDYNYLLEKDDEVDDDNLLTSLLRKNISSASMFVKSLVIKHDQYLSRSLSAKAMLTIKQIAPVFPFTYHPLDKFTDIPIDTVSHRKLPVIEGMIGLRYSKGQKVTVFNYDLVRQDNFNPIITANFIYGFETSKAQFSYNKINIGLEQRLQLPPKSIFYYKITAGKTFGMAPYLLLDVPAGNETYVDSKYSFNTMLPYEYAADQYADLHTRLFLGGVLFDKIPLLNKMGLRERFSFNAHMGSMTNANRNFNDKATFAVTGNKPFMEAGVGIENIFHLLSVDYFWRLTKNNSRANIPMSGWFIGLRVAF